MNILLINSNQLKVPYPLIPIGLCYIASTLEKEDYNVKILDLCFIRNTEKAIRDEINFFKPDVIGVTIRNIDASSGSKDLFLIKHVKEKVTDYCKKYFSGPIVVGGAAVGINGEEILNYLDLEYAIYGDGEFAFLELVRRLEKGKSVSKMSGLIWRKNGKIIEKNKPEYLKDLNSIPFAKPYKYLNLFKYKVYNTTIQIQTKRGCALKCSYCTYNGIEGYTYRYRDPELIVDEIEDIIKNSNIKNVEIVDSIFNIPLDHAKNVLRAIADRKIRLNLFSMVINPKAVDEEFAALLKKCRVSDVGVGVESGCDEVLEKLGKNFTSSDIITASKLLKGKVHSIQWFLILGAEGESYETIIKTFQLMKKVSSLWDIVFSGIGLRVYKDSPISRRLLQKNPNITSDNFFSPFGYEPENIDLKTIKLLSVIYFFKYYNFFMYDISAQLPVFFRLFLKLVFPRSPLWKILIYTKFLFKITGFSIIITKIIEMLNYKKLKKINYKFFF